MGVFKNWGETAKPLLKEKDQHRKGKSTARKKTLIKKWGGGGKCVIGFALNNDESDERKNTA